MIFVKFNLQSKPGSNYNYSILNIVILLWLLWQPGLVSQISYQSLPKTGLVHFSCRFERVFQQEPQSPDSTTGVLYLLGPEKMFIHIEKPLQQILLLDGNETTIYYPDDLRAFLLVSQNPATMPIVSGLMNVLRYQQGMAELGFKLGSQKMHGDTLTTHWQHPKIPESAGRYQLGEVENRLVFSRFEDTQKALSIETLYHDYQKLNNFFFPTRIITRIAREGQMTIEKIVLQNLQSDDVIPSEVQNFTVPENVVLERRRW